MKGKTRKKYISPATLSYDKTVHYGRFHRPEEDDLVDEEVEEDRTEESVDHIEPVFPRAHVTKTCRSTQITLLMLEDWVYLTLLGITMAFCSLILDIAIEQMQRLHFWLFDLVKDLDVLLSLSVWICFAVVTISASALWAHFVAPQAIGSGIPEMKTILRGVVLKEYLSFRTLISKMVALTLSLGSGLPIGKEGPFVHVASIVANLLSQLVHRKGAFRNECRSVEMLAAGCAVGVACTFSAPVGGVLFSIEVTTVYFAVRNYWRGFYASACSAMVFSMLKLMRGTPAGVSIVPASTISVRAHFQTEFPIMESYIPHELPIFALVGVMCGFLGAFFIWSHRRLVIFLRTNRVSTTIFKKFWILYPILISFLIASLSYPLGIGRYLGGELRFSDVIRSFFYDCSLLAHSNSTQTCPKRMAVHWTGSDEQIFPLMSIAVFHVVYFFLSILASTLPVPAGIFMPVFVLGAAFGRLFGEIIRLYSSVFFRNVIVRPGIYGVVGAAAFCGAVTHTVSVAVIVFELTGQLTFILPVMVAVLAANAICSYLQPSIYDSIIQIKHLPYLPDMPPSSSAFHYICVDEFMVRSVAFVAKDYTFGELRHVLKENPRLRAFPIVDAKASRMLIGSTTRSQLTNLLEAKIGIEARRREAKRRFEDAVKEMKERMISMAIEKKQPAENEDDKKNCRPKNDSFRTNRFTVEAVPFNDLNPGGNEEDFYSRDSVRSTRSLDLSSLYPMGKKRRPTDPDHSDHHKDIYHSVHGFLRSITKSFYRQKKSNGITASRLDLHGEDLLEWENTVLAEPLDISSCHIDPAPFQLIRQTSLFKVHSLFSMLALKRAYVTDCGTLIGVVSLKQLRHAIEVVTTGTQDTLVKSASQASAEIDEDDIPFIHPRLEVVAMSRVQTADEKLDILSENEASTGLILKNLLNATSTEVRPDLLSLWKDRSNENSTKSCDV